MGGNDNDGYYCTICGGIPPDKITTRRINVDGKETGNRPASTGSLTK